MFGGLENVRIFVSDNNEKQHKMIIIKVTLLSVLAIGFIGLATTLVGGAIFGMKEFREPKKIDLDKIIRKQK